MEDALVLRVLHSSSRKVCASVPVIRGSGTALPRHRYGQRELAAVARRLLPGLATKPGTIERFFRSVGLEERHLALPLEQYEQLSGLKQRNDAWLEHAIPLAQQALERALADAGLEAGQLSALFTTTITGIAVPSIDARLMNRLPLSPSLKRTPLFGLGCLAGAAGVARAADYLRAYPDQAAALVSVELCSLATRLGLPADALASRSPYAIPLYASYEMRSTTLPRVCLLSTCCCACTACSKLYTS